ncbi:MAG: hypothetical protein IT370_28950 [Deltaproteobacteria bacterium]|nr:hypothetical protein [Deltaproteobacteria bacterium]
MLRLLLAVLLCTATTSVAAASETCAVKEDVLVQVPYPDSGGVWIPREAACGGDFPLLILLHGENADRERHILVGGWMKLEPTVRALIDAGKMKPVLLAEPVQLGAKQDTLYTSRWDPVEHLARLEKELAAHQIRVTAIGYLGHSAAGCQAKGGLYKVLSMLDELGPRVNLWAAADICYLGNYHWLEPANKLARRNITMLNLHVAHPTGGFENGMDLTRKITCPPGYKKCMAHRRENWCSFRAKRGTGIDHKAAPGLLVRDLLLRVYPAEGAPRLCKK